jgi:hypothetical protein
MVNAAYRVASRFLWGAVIADPKEALHKFSEAVTFICRLEDFAKSDLEKLRELAEYIKLPTSPESNNHGRTLLEQLKETSGQRYDLEYQILSGFNYVKLQGQAEQLFWAILQQYVLPPRLRSGIESASRFWSKRRLQIRYKNRRGYEHDAELLQYYLKLCVVMRKQVTDAQAAIVKGKLQADPAVAEQTTTKVGSFKVINTGGFRDDVMDKAAEVVNKAEKAMRSIGLGRVCYGDILVSKTVNNKRTVAAFYILASDEMFIRANTPTNWDTIRIVCHELTHRLQHKFLSAKKAEINNIYRNLKAQAFLGRGIPDEYWPHAGDKVVLDQGRKVTVTSVHRSRSKVEYVSEEKPPVRWSAPIEAWIKMKGLDLGSLPGFKGFITPYARTDPDENFAEMVSFFAIGKLPQDQIALLEPILN